MILKAFWFVLIFCLLHAFAWGAVFFALNQPSWIMVLSGIGGGAAIVTADIVIGIRLKPWFQTKITKLTEEK